MKCLRCGHDKKLEPLFEFIASRPVATNFYVCSERIGCRTRQLAVRPARLSTEAHPQA